jgi:succinate dehydrogenase / fumarate reductase iron-sulfur subunit
MSKTIEGKTIEVQVKRQLTADSEPFWEEFSLPYKPNMNLIAVLLEIAASPKTKQGKNSVPVTYDANCLEEVCGACTMIVNGKSRQACTALVDHLEQPIRLEPLTKFPVVRDLQVNRGRLFNDLKRVKAWIPIDGSYDLGVGPRMSQRTQEESYPFSRCISCGNCLEVCPQYNDETGFVGAAVIGQVRLFNAHPTGEMNAHERLMALTGPGGIHECGYAQNCVTACPKEIPLTAAISQVGLDVVKESVLTFLRG